MCSPVVLDAGNPKLRCWDSHSPVKALGKSPSLLAASGGFRHSLAYGSITPFSASVFTQLSPLWLCGGHFSSYSESESCSVVSDSLRPHGTVHGVLQARILEWVAVPFSRGSSQSRDQTPVSHTAGGFYTSSHQGSPSLLIRTPVTEFRDHPTPISPLLD